MQWGVCHVKGIWAKKKTSAGLSEGLPNDTTYETSFVNSMVGSPVDRLLSRSRRAGILHIRFSVFSLPFPQTIFCTPGPFHSHAGCSWRDWGEMPVGRARMRLIRLGIEDLSYAGVRWTGKESAPKCSCRTIVSVRHTLTHFALTALS